MEPNFFECISMAVIDSWVLFYSFSSGIDMKVEALTKRTAMFVLKTHDGNVNRPNRIEHKLSDIPSKSNRQLI